MIHPLKSCGNIQRLFSGECPEVNLKDFVYSVIDMYGKDAIARLDTFFDFSPTFFQSGPTNDAICACRVYKKIAQFLDEGRKKLFVEWKEELTAEENVLEHAMCGDSVEDILLLLEEIKDKKSFIESGSFSSLLRRDSDYSFLPEMRALFSREEWETLLSKIEWYMLSQKAIMKLVEMDSDFFQPSHLLEIIDRAIDKNSDDLLPHVLQKLASMTPATWSEKERTLFICIYTKNDSNPAVLSLLLEHAMDIIFTLDEGYLFFSIAHKQPNLIHTFLQKAQDKEKVKEFLQEKAPQNMRQILDLKLLRTLFDYGLHFFMQNRQGQSLIYDFIADWNWEMVDFFLFQASAEDMKRLNSEKHSLGSPLHLAVNGKQYALVERLLHAEGAPINNGDNRGLTPLSCAIMQGDERSVQLLLQNGAKMQKGDAFFAKLFEKGNVRAISFAVLKKCFDRNVLEELVKDNSYILKAILSGGEKALEFVLEYRAPQPYDEEEVASYFFAALLTKSIQMVRLLLSLVPEEKLKSLFSYIAEEEDARTLFEQAVKIDFFDAVQLFLEVGAEGPSSQEDQNFLLEEAVGTNNGLMLRCILGLVHKDSTQDRLYLQQALNQGFLEGVHLLLEYGCDFSTLDLEEKKHLFDLAIAREDIEMVQLALQNLTKKEVKYVVEDSLHQVASAGFTEGVELLLHLGVSPHIKDYEGNTPLHKACKKGHAMATVLLLEHGAKEVHKNRDRNAPYDLLPSAKKGEVKKLIKERVHSILFKKHSYTHLSAITGQSVSLFRSFAKGKGIPAFLQRAKDRRSAISLILSLCDKRLSQALVDTVGFHTVFEELQQLEKENAFSSFTFQKLYKDCFALEYDEGRTAFYKDQALSDKDLQEISHHKIKELQTIFALIKERGHFNEKDEKLLELLVSRVEKREPFFGSPPADKRQALENWYQGIEEALLLVIHKLIKDLDSEEGKDKAVEALSACINTMRFCGSQLLTTATTQKTTLLRGYNETFKDAVLREEACLNQSAAIEAAPRDEELSSFVYNPAANQVHFYNGIVGEEGRKALIPGYSVHERHKDQIYQDYKNQFSQKVWLLKRNMLRRYRTLKPPHRLIAALQTELAKESGLSELYHSYMREHYFPTWKEERAPAFIKEAEKVAHLQFKQNNNALKKQRKDLLQKAKDIAKRQNKDLEDVSVYKRYKELPQPSIWNKVKRKLTEQQLFEQYKQNLYKEKEGEQIYYADCILKALKNIAVLKK